MSQSDWRDNATFRLAIAVVGLLGMLALVAVIVLAMQGERQQQQSAEAEQSYANADQLLAACLGVYGEENAPSDERCEEARAQADLRAQGAMADAAWSQFWLNIGSVALLFATVVFAYRAWREAKKSAKAGKKAARQAKRQADIAQRQLEEARIPEIFVDVPDETIIIRTTTSIPKVHVRISNVGTTLAVITGGAARLSYDISALAVTRVGSDEFFAPEAHARVISVNRRPLPPGGKPLTFEVQCVDDDVVKQMTDAPIGGLGGLVLDMGGPNFFISGWVEFRNQWGDNFSEGFAFFYSAPNEPGLPENFTEFRLPYKIEPGTYQKCIQRRAIQRGHRRE